ncbi:MAG: hypothetical protein OD918_08845 [Gammaproteobacteria bacterium]
MSQEQLQEKLSVLISGFGYETVRKTLGKMKAGQSVCAKRSAASRRIPGARSSDCAAKKRAKPNAVNTVTSTDIADSEKKKILIVLAEKYEAKKFMPNVTHVRAFLSNGERDVSRIKSRQQVTVAVFKQLAALETGKLREMLERGLYGPPKRLEAFARAIEGFDRPARPD